MVCHPKKKKDAWGRTVALRWFSVTPCSVSISLFMTYAHRCSYLVFLSRVLVSCSCLVVHDLRQQVFFLNTHILTLTLTHTLSLSLTIYSHLHTHTHTHTHTSTPPPGVRFISSGIRQAKPRLPSPAPAPPPPPQHHT